MYEVAYRDMLGEWADVFAFRGRVEVSCAQDLAVTLERGVQSSVYVCKVLRVYGLGFRRNGQENKKTTIMGYAGCRVVFSKFRVP